MWESGQKNFLVLCLVGSALLGGLTGGMVAGLMLLYPEPVHLVLGRVSGGFFADQPVSRPLSVVEDSAATDVVRTVSPAVVSIEISAAVTGRSAFGFSPFDDFFGFPSAVPESTEGTPQLQVVGGGSGFIVSADGMIVTNKHVVEDPAATYTVVLNDGRRLPAKVLALDPLLDLAVIRIEATGLPTAELGDSDSLRVGQTVIAIGNPLSELPNTVTKGIISGINRRITAGGIGGSEVIEAAIQTDAAINPGNSGGPLVNLAGQVVGVNTAVSRPAQGVGFAIPVNLVQQAVTSVEKRGRIVRPWLGVRYVFLTPDIARENDLTLQAGAFIAPSERTSDPAIIPGSPADRAGLREGDIITAVDGQLVGHDQSLSALLGRKSPGEKVVLTVHRGNEDMQITATLGEFDLTVTKE